MDYEGENCYMAIVSSDLKLDLDNLENVPWKVREAQLRALPEIPDMEGVGGACLSVLFVKGVDYNCSPVLPHQAQVRL
jgi:hypothetical protein